MKLKRQKGKNSMLKKVEISAISTSQLPNLPNTEIEGMLRRIKNGEPELKDEFIRSNLRLILSVVQRFSGRKENMDDLFQIGCIGLIKAIDNFDFSYNVKFSTYAVPMILGEIRRYLRDNSSSIRVSRSLKDIAYKTLKLKEELKKDNLSAEEISKHLNVPVEEVVLALDAIIEPYSLYDTVYNDNGDSIYVLDQVKDKKNKEENWVNKLALTEAVKKLAPKEKKIIDMRYYEGKTQVEVAEEIGISQAQVSRLEKYALERIKKNYEPYIV